MKKHLKRLAAPRSWKIHRKEHTWATRPSPGPHGLEESVPLLFILRDVLDLCDTAREGKRIISSRRVLVDGKPVTNHKHPVGLMDVISIPEVNMHYRMLLDRRGRLTLVEINEKEATWKLVRIENKATTKGGKIQLNLHDGRNLLLKSNKYRTGDVLKIEVPTQKIIGHYEFKKGSKVMLSSGKHVGEIATVKKYEKSRNPRENIVEFQEGFSTTKRNVFIVGKKSLEVLPPETSALQVRK